MRQLRHSVTNAQYSVRAISEQADSMDDVVRLDIGQPDFDTPAAVKKAAQHAIDHERITYTSLFGIPELRDQIATSASHKHDYSPEQVLVTTGGSGALYCLFTALCEPGDGIVFNDPSWSVYSTIAHAASVRQRRVPYFHNGTVNVDGIEETIDERTKAIVINNPENPTGRLYSHDELEQLIGVAERNDLWVIGDEVYDRLIYEGDHTSVSSITPERSFVVNSMSKNFAMTGWRLGWLLAPDNDLVQELGKVNRATTACPNFVSQHAALAALRRSQSYADEMVAVYRERRDLIEDYLERMGLAYPEPQGAIYVFPDVEKDSWTFARQLLDEAGVAVIPGSPSGSASHTNIRICFGSVDKEGIREGMERMEQFLE